jgi:peptidoglycan/LPS O-acetylase OafA/YrhL
MRQFLAIEGLRAWLAWAVVVSHVVQTSDLFRTPIGSRFWHAGHWAVLIFIIISGFVITHLILERRPPYLSFVGQRFMRLYPAYALSCLLGFATMPLYAAVLNSVAYTFDPSYVRLMQGLAQTQYEFMWQHILAHATMLHGAISNSILPYSGYALSGVTWSVSLEWQFYLLAPVIVMLALDKRIAPMLALVVVAGHLLFQRGYLGDYMNLSLLPAAGAYFLLGILCRIGMPKIDGKISSPITMAACLLAFMPLCPADLNIVLLWGIFYLFICSDRRMASPYNSIAQNLFSTLFESKIARYFGSRSYSIYLFHFIIVTVSHYALTRSYPSAGRGETLVILLAVVCPATAIVSELSYRMVERPGIRLGQKWFSFRPLVAQPG